MGKAISLPRPIHSPAPEDRNREGVWPVPLDPARYLLMSTRRNREAIVTEHSFAGTTTGCAAGLVRCWAAAQ